MKDIPIFTGQFGVGTLILREIPYKQCAYVLVRSAREGQMREFLEECSSFCRAAGAEWVLASAPEPLSFLPHVHDMLEYACPREQLPPPLRPVELEPLSDRNAERYREIYNDLFRAIPNAATCTPEDLRRLREKDTVFLALVGGETAGICQWSGSELEAIGVLPAFRGLGHRLALTAFERMEGETITLRVSSSNTPALRLYQKLGFDRSRVLSSWYALAGADLTAE